MLQDVELLMKRPEETLTCGGKKEMQEESRFVANSLPNTIIISHVHDVLNVFSSTPTLCVNAYVLLKPPSIFLSSPPSQKIAFFILYHIFFGKKDETHGSIPPLGIGWK